MQPTETDSDDSEDIPKTAADLVSDLKVALRPRHLQCLKLCQDGLHEKLMQTNRLHTYFGDDSDHGEPWPAGIPHAPKEQVARLLQEPRVQHYEPADAAEAKMLSLEEFLEEQKKRNIRKSPRFSTGGGKGAVGFCWLCSGQPSRQWLCHCYKNGAWSIPKTAPSSETNFEETYNGENDSSRPSSRCPPYRKCSRPRIWQSRTWQRSRRCHRFKIEETRMEWEEWWEEKAERWPTQAVVFRQIRPENVVTAQADVWRKVAAAKPWPESSREICKHVYVYMIGILCGSNYIFLCTSLVPKQCPWTGERCGRCI